jgi:hypothetical protein
MKFFPKIVSVTDHRTPPPQRSLLTVGQTTRSRLCATNGAAGRQAAPTVRNPFDNSQTRLVLLAFARTPKQIGLAANSPVLNDLLQNSERRRKPKVWLLVHLRYPINFQTSRRVRHDI